MERVGGLCITSDALLVIHIRVRRVLLLEVDRRLALLLAAVLLWMLL